MLFLDYLNMLFELFKEVSVYDFCIVYSVCLELSGFLIIYYILVKRLIYENSDYYVCRLWIDYDCDIECFVLKKCI